MGVPQVGAEKIVQDIQGVDPEQHFEPRPAEKHEYEYSLKQAREREINKVCQNVPGQGVENPHNSLAKAYYVPVVEAWQALRRTFLTRND